MVRTLLFLFVASTATALQASDYFTVCHKNDPKFDECLISTVENMKPLLKKGSKDLKIPSVEPMVVSKVEVKQGSGSVSIDSTFTNLKVIGISNFKVVRVKSDLQNGLIEFSVEMPYLYTEGGYDIQGRVLVLPITGSGDSWSNYTGVSGIMTLQLKPVERSGETYMDLEKLTFDMKVKGAVIHMDNLFNGNKQLGDAMNKFMSDNFEVVFQELKPAVDAAISAILQNVASKVFSRFPANQLFPE